MLKAAGLPLYRHLNVHGYWLVRDTKMSKSLGNVVEPLEMGQRYGVDAFRYFLLREMRFGADASFSEEALVTRLNADLANDLGNLFSRVLSMTAKYFGSIVPRPGVLRDADKAIAGLCADAMRNFLQLFDQTQFSQALEALWELVRGLNKYADAQAPWTLHKRGDMERLATVMYVLLAAMRKAALCLWPVMPAASAAMLAQLGQACHQGRPPVARLDDEADSLEGLAPGTHVAAESNLFPRIDAKKEHPLSGREKKAAGKAQNAPQQPARPQAGDGAAAAAPPSLPEVDVSRFKALDLRVGTVRAADKHPDADRILRLEIDFGEGRTRQILSGLAEQYAPADLVGKKVCAVLNLPPRKIRGLVSYGMVLTAERDGKLGVLTVDRDVPDGGRIA